MRATTSAVAIVGFTKLDLNVKRRATIIAARLRPVLVQIIPVAASLGLVLVPSVPIDLYDRFTLGLVLALNVPISTIAARSDLILVPNVPIFTFAVRPAGLVLARNVVIFTTTARPRPILVRRVSRSFMLAGRETSENVVADRTTLLYLA